MSSFDCFSGGTQPGAGGGDLPIARLVGAFHLFSGGEVDPDPTIHLKWALLAADVGDVAILYGGPGNLTIVGIWQKIGSSPNRIRLYGGHAWLNGVWPADPSLIIGTDITLARGTAPADLPTWANGGLQLEPDTIPVFDAAGTWDEGGIWNSVVYKLKAASTPNAGAYVGSGWASNGKARGTGGGAAQTGSLFHRRWFSGDGGLAAGPMTILGSVLASNRTSPLDDEFKNYSTRTGFSLISDIGSVAHKLSVSGYMVHDKYSAAEGGGGTGGTLSPATQVDDTDRMIMMFADSAGGVDIDAVATEIDVFVIPG